MSPPKAWLSGFPGFFNRQPRKDSTMIQKTISIEEPIEAGKSSFEMVPLHGGDYLLIVKNYGVARFTCTVKNRSEAKGVIANTFPQGVL